MLTKIEKKMLAEYDTIGVGGTNKGFILSDGSIIAVADHASTCKAIGHRLSTVIHAGVCQFLLQQDKEDGIAAFEFSRLSMKQKIAISLILRANDYYVVITTRKTTSKFRPIRSIKF